MVYGFFLYAFSLKEKPQRFTNKSKASIIYLYNEIKDVIAMKKCIHCGAQLPDSAGFCPYCRRRQKEENARAARARPWGKLMVIGAVILLALLVWGAAALISHLQYTPVTLSTQSSTIHYADRSGSYLLCLRWDDGAAGDLVSRVISEGEEGSAVSLLYAYDAESGEDRRAAFQRRLESLIVTAEPESVTLDTPRPDGGAVRGAALTYTAESGTSAIVWSLCMKNGDTITLRHSLRAVKQRSFSYSYRDYDLSTLEKLEEFLAKLLSGANAGAVTTIYLPPVQYEGGLRLTDRAFAFVGSSDGEQRTTFTDTVYVQVRTPQIVEFTGVSFLGSGGVGLSAEEGAILRGCSFEGWDIGVDSRDGSWVAAFDCDFIANGVGFRFNSGASTLASPTYSGNQFIGNGIGFQILKTPSREVLSFPGCRFERNSKDIDNQSSRSVNTKGAVFVKNTA